MGFLTRRQPAPLVEARRTPADPLPPMTVVMPSVAPPAPAAPSPSSSSHVTQNFFYPPPQPAPPQPAPPPVPAPMSGPTHYQTTVHHYYARRSERKLSFSGTVGLVLGVLACAAASAPAAQPFARWLALGGAAAGGLGLLSSGVLGLTRVGVPLLAVLAAAAGLGLSLRTAGSPSPLTQLRSMVPTQLPALPFQMDPSPVTPAKTPPLAPAAPAPRPVQPSAQPLVPSSASPDLEAARVAAGRSIGIDYAALVAGRDAAAAALQQARATMELGSPALIDANQRFMRADAALTAARQRLQSDPAVAAAQKGSTR